MYIHDITGRIFYNIYYITLYIYAHILIYGMSMEIVLQIGYGYSFAIMHTNLENIFCISIHIYFIYIMQ